MTAQVQAKPALLVGSVWHRRVRPARHAFTHGVATLRLPLRALAAGRCAWNNRWFSHNRFNLLGFHDADHGDGQTAPLAWADALLHAHGIGDADGEIWLHTFPRVLGYVFNPVSFWFCERADGALRAVVCEVNNTFGERHCYLLDTGAPIADGQPLTAEKAFYVSPFCEVAGHYTFRFTRVRQAGLPGQRWRYTARIDYGDAQGPILLTSITGAARDLTARAALQAFFRFPLMTMGVVVRIHWQALRLWLKRVPLQARPAPEAAAADPVRRQSR